MNKRMEDRLNNRWENITEQLKENGDYDTYYGLTTIGKENEGKDRITIGNEFISADIDPRIPTRWLNKGYIALTLSILNLFCCGVLSIISIPLAIAELVQLKKQNRMNSVSKTDAIIAIIISVIISVIIPLIAIIIN